MHAQVQHRKQLRRLEIPGHLRFLTFSCHQRLPLFENDKIKQVFVDRLMALQIEKPFELFAWVLMPEHVHMILRPRLPECSVADLMRALKRPTAERVLHRWKRLNAPVLARLKDRSGLHFWQAGGGYDRNIIGESEFIEKMNYIHKNPCRRGLVTSATDWPFSSARWYAGIREGQVPISPFSM
jgi:putative transposase